MANRDKNIDAWLLAGQSLLSENRHAEAAAAFARVQHALPHEITAALMVANAWKLAGNAVAARESLLSVYARETAANSLEAADIPAVFELGASLLDAGAPEEARQLFERVVRRRPKDPAALGALAGATRAAGDPQRAWPIVQRALATAGKQPALLLTAAQIRHALGDLTRARYWLDRAEAVRPNHAPTRLQRALTSLLGGPTADGWADFEHRGLPTPPVNGAAPWKGESLAGQSILVTAEQGQGDHFQFVRYVPALRALGASRVIVECHRHALSLFIASGFDAVVVGGARATDWYVPMLSLPHRLGVSADVASAHIPYLHTGVASAYDPQAAARLDTLDTLDTPRRRLGLVWQGNPAFLSTTLRDFDPGLLPRLLDIPNISWVSLQVGSDTTVSHSRLEQRRLSGEWLDTARLLTALDGVVTVDTGIAHLAGAMGVRSYVMLPFTPDWRWGLGTDATPWYPAARLFRQRTPRDWSSVIDQLTRTFEG